MFDPWVVSGSWQSESMDPISLIRPRSVSDSPSNLILFFCLGADADTNRRYLAQAVATANNEPTSDIPRRLIRRGNGSVYNPSRIIAWNHQLLPTFNKFNQFRSNPDARANNNKRSSDWVNQATLTQKRLLSFHAVKRPHNQIGRLLSILLITNK